MIEQALIDTIVADTDITALPHPTARGASLPRMPGKAVAVVGMRRVGKTWRLFQDVHEQLAGGLAPEDVLYLNFEDERLAAIEATDLQRLVDAHRRRHPEAAERPLWLYLDEVQEIPGWEKFVRRHIDLGTTVTVTGSSARLLSREIATSLRGRSLSMEMLPFSFREALVHAGEELPTVWPPPAPVRARLAAAFDRYLRVGGFPEVQGVDEALRLRVLQDYTDVVVLRDVAERHGVRNVAALRYVVRRLLDAPAGLFSVHRLYNDLKSQGHKIGKDTLHAVLGHVEDAYLLFTMPIDSRSASVRASNPRKAYPIDPGLAAAHSFIAARNTGHLLETAVYLELRRRGYDTAYVRTRSGFEVDFVARRRGEDADLLVQVAADVSAPATRERELRALQEAMEQSGRCRALLVTVLAEETVQLDCGVVEIVPAWRWLLEPPGCTS